MSNTDDGTIFHGHITYTARSLGEAEAAVRSAMTDIRNGFGGGGTNVYDFNAVALVPLDAATTKYDWASAGIRDARAYRIGDDPLVHEPTHVGPNLIRSACGIFTPVTETDEPRAEWADALPDCPKCLAATS
jgi:hypothetical protein